MEKKFKLSIIPNYRKLIWALIALSVCTIIPIFIFDELGSKNLTSSVYVVIIGLTTFLVIRKAYFKDTVTLKDKSLKIPKMGNIDYLEISKYKVKTKYVKLNKFTSVIITLKEGGKLVIGPTDNFSISAENIFIDFIVEFENKAKNIVNRK